MTRGLRAIALGVALCAVFSFAGFSADCAAVREQVVRLHVLAHSDSEEDQQLKLQVRDGVLTAAAGIFDGITDPETARQTAQEHLPRLQQAAADTVAAAGYDYPVWVSLCQMYFSTRQYEAGQLPAGVYAAIRVVIGDGAGKNWWCVAFPPLCVGAATDNAATWEDVLSPPQRDLVENPSAYAVRFKVVEWVESLRHRVFGDES